jgi:RNase H-like domain found in reverse transcriptase
MCDASDYAVGAVLEQRVEKKSHVIYYASKVLDEAQVNYTTTEKELLAIVFAIKSHGVQRSCCNPLLVEQKGR